MDSWPLFALVLRTRELELRLLRDEELDVLARRSAGRVLPAEQADYMDTDWTQQPSPEYERAFLQFHWDMRAQWRPEGWSLMLGAFSDGEPIGGFSLIAKRFPQRRVVRSGSWLLPEWRGRGLGREGRVALLTLAFDGLGAEEAITAAHPDNSPSRRISLGLGYEESGLLTMERPAGDVAPRVEMRLARSTWAAVEHPPVTISGLDEAWAMFGMTQRSPDLRIHP